MEILRKSIFIILFSACQIAMAKGPHDFSKVVAKVSPAVVKISIKSNPKPINRGEIPEFPKGSPFGDLFRFFEAPENPLPEHALGSGFIVDPKGYIITCHHVIQDADEVTVTFGNGEKQEYIAEVVGMDARTDLAVLKIDAKKELPFVQWGDSKHAKPGQWAIAIGNPFGLDGTVSVGVISMINRGLMMGPDGPDFADGSFIQTDASVNRGNSGGPLFNAGGKVIGVNNIIYSTSGGNMGLAFAIPSEIVRNVYEQIRKYGRTKRGWLGVVVQPLDQDLRDYFNLEKKSGTFVNQVVEGSPAEDAGIKQGDIILKFDDHEVEDSNRLPRIVGETSVGTTVDVIVLREENGEIINKTLQVAVEEYEQAEENGVISGHKSSEKNTQKTGYKALGLTVEKSTKAAIRNYRQLPMGERKGIPEIPGVIVTNIDVKSTAAEKGIRVGDIIESVNMQDVTTPKEFLKAINNAKKGDKKTVLLGIHYSGRTHFKAIPLAEKSVN